MACVAECNKKLEMTRREKIRKGELLGDQEELIIIGNNVLGFFPNITSAKTGRIVRYKVQESKLKFEGMSFKQVSLYCIP